MEEESAEKTNNEPKLSYIKAYKYLKYTLVFLVGVTLGFLHYLYVSTLFENDRNFSHLSNMEREISLRTEMGFYYSYYKTVVEGQPFVQGVSRLMADRLVEYPNEVNTFNRFNIAPELVIGAVYRYLEPWLNTSTYRQCHTVYRGDEAAPVESCVGAGEPMLFYLEWVWALAGLLVCAVFLSAYSLSNSVVGGLVAVASYFANHSECTRVQWAPNERENMAAPLLFLQTALVARQLRRPGGTHCRVQVALFLVNSICLLFWQFTQFVFLTQIAIIFLMEQLRIIDTKALCVHLHAHFSGLHIAILLLQGNDMLKTSLYTSLFIVLSIYCLMFSTFRIKVQNRFDLCVEAWLVLLRIFIVVTASFYIKHLLSDFLQIHDDTHIWDILYSKLTSFKSFHTLIYTCSETFDFLPWSSVRNMFRTGLIPMALVGVFSSVYTWFANGRSEGEAGDIPRWLRVRVEPAVVYQTLQLAVFAAMAALVMRLKLLLATQLCVMSSLVVRARTDLLPAPLRRGCSWVWVLCGAWLWAQLLRALSTQLGHVGEFSDFQQEELLNWIQQETGARAAFAGSMPLLAAVMLVTRRPVVAHPHYENKEARDRAYAVYKTYGKFPTEELYKELTRLKASYLVVEHQYCYGKSRTGCTFEDIWDIEAPQHRGRPRACHRLLTEPAEHFYPVFRNAQYAVFRIHDYSVMYMPRSFDT